MLYVVHSCELLHYGVGTYVDNARCSNNGPSHTRLTLDRSCQRTCSRSVEKQASAASDDCRTHQHPTADNLLLP